MNQGKDQEKTVSQATILAIRGVDQGMKLELNEEQVGIGRGVGNGFRLADTEASRRHAVIQRDGNAFLISDQGSSNGTFVNGVAIRVHRLQDGDQIQCGRTTILFNSIDSEESRALRDHVDMIAEKSSDDRSSIIGKLGDFAAPTKDLPDSTMGGENLEQTLTILQALYRITEETVSSTLTLEQLLKRILDLTIEVVGADRGCLLISDPETEEIEPNVFSHGSRADISGKMPVSRTIVNFVLEERQGVRTSDARHDQRFEPGESIVQAGIREAMCVPMSGRFELLGAIYVDITTPPERMLLDATHIEKFRDEHLRMLLAIGRQAALSIENFRYQQALIKSERLATMGQTVATISHHVKNILQGIRGGSYLIDMGLKEHNEEFIHKGWSIVEKNQGKIYHLVMDMLSFSKERQPETQPASLEEVLNDVFELVKSRAEEGQVQLELQCEETLPTSMFDVEGIHRAILNIVLNAIQAVEEKPDACVVIEPGLDESSDTLFVKVTDNGPGIPPEQMTNIFQAFESSKGSRGTGLGLAVSRKIVREHGGEITVESREGEGSQFLVAWPRVNPGSASMESQTQPG